MTWTDISMPLAVQTPPWPGDAPLALRTAVTDEGGAVQVTEATLSLHLGTHVDAPLHTLAGAAPIGAMPLDAFAGEAVVWDVSRAGERIGPADLARAEGESGAAPRVLLKTRATQPGRRFPKEWKALTPAAAQWLAARGVVLLGLDAPSPDPLESQALPVHRILAARGIALVENLVLWNVRAGRYALAAQPLAIAGAEASPVRAMIRSL